MTPEARSLDDFELIPRDLIFGNPERALVKVSPDGTQLSWLAPKNGVLNVWVAPVDDLEAARPVTADTFRGIREYRWTYRKGTLLYRQDTDGDEDFHVYSVDVDSGEVRDLTPYDKTNALIDGLSHLHPDVVLLGINDRDAAWHDVYRVDLTSGDRTLVELNTEGMAGYLSDGDLNLTHAIQTTDEGGITYLRRGEEGWEVFDEVSFEDAVSIPMVGPTIDGSTLYMTDNRGRNTAALFAVDTTTYERTLLFEDPRADIANLLLNPATGVLEAVAVNYLSVSWHPIVEGIAADLAVLEREIPGELIVDSRSLDDRTWIVSGSPSNGPVTYYRYERDGGGTVTRLFSVRPKLEGKPLVKRHPVEITSRDGKTLVSYLAVPPHVDFDESAGASMPTPMVLLVHGGPWHRDSYGYDANVQWLANRGYSVLQVNFRGSTGLGKEFLNDGNAEWAGKMHDDLLDAVDWAVAHGVTTPDRVAIMGGSYGGYATLVGLTFTPDVFACGVDIVGPSNLHTLLATVPPYWASFYTMLTRRMGDPETEQGRAWLTERSPLNRVDAIKKPLLIGQGANDPRVKQAESDQIVDAMVDRNIPVTYVLFPDEGHGFARPANNKAMNAIIEGFLGKILGGRVEPIGDDLKGSSLQVPVGADLVEGLSETLATARADA